MNKKGFTLTELIVVICIIGVLSTIASTAVIGHIVRNKKNAALRSGISYVNAINDYNFISEGENLITSGNTSTITPMLNNSYDGTRPTSGTVVIDSTTKKVSSAELNYNSYVVTYDGNNFSVHKE